MSPENGDGVVEATAVEEAAPVPAVPDLNSLIPAGGATVAVTPQVQAPELVKRLDVIKEAQAKAMVEKVDYGVIPGTKKPTLLKPGAEKLSVLFQLDVQIVNEKVWGPDDHLTVISRATAFHAPSGTRLGYGEGICTTREKKYAVRQQQRHCPKCGKATIFESNQDRTFFCWKKKGGCGANFPAGDQRITDQDQGEVPNPDLPDLWNTVVKMAEKRARVDVVLAVTGASALFTQDVEDGQPSPDQERREAPEYEPEEITEPLDPERVGRIGEAITRQQLSYTRIGQLLSACGINGLRAASGKALKERVDSLKPEQADKLEAALERLAQDDAAEEPQEAPAGV